MSISEEFELMHDDKEWSKASPDARKRLKDNQAALALWKKGTEKPKFLAVQPKDISNDIPLDHLEASQKASTFQRLAVLNIKRLESESKLEESVAWIRALFRFGCHYGQYSTYFNRFAGYAFYHSAMYRYRRLAENPDVSIELLRQTMVNLDDDIKLTPSLSENIRAEYYQLLSYDDLPGDYKIDDWKADNSVTKTSRFLWELRYYMKGEPEKNVQLIKHSIANVLSDIDKPRHAQPSCTPHFKLFITSSLLMPAHDLESIILGSSYTPSRIEPLTEMSNYHAKNITKQRLL